jgi:hypothetical protein
MQLWDTYQPGDRFWTFQLTEAAILHERAAGLHGLGTCVVGALFVPVGLAEGDVAAVGRPGVDHHRLRCRQAKLVRTRDEVDVDDAERELVPFGQEHRSAIGGRNTSRLWTSTPSSLR